LKEALIIAQLMGANCLMVQSYCMYEGRVSATWGAAIYEDCHTVWLGLDDISIEHCNRDANSVAHELAKRLLEPHTCIWIDEPPS
jgi:sugar phosphate isomerase/epimerase